MTVYEFRCASCGAVFGITGLGGDVAMPELCPTCGREGLLLRPVAVSGGQWEPGSLDRAATRPAGEAPTAAERHPTGAAASRAADAGGLEGWGVGEIEGSSTALAGAHDAEVEAIPDLLVETPPAVPMESERPPREVYEFRCTTCHAAYEPAWGGALCPRCGGEGAFTVSTETATAPALPTASPHPAQQGTPGAKEGREVLDPEGLLRKMGWVSPDPDSIPAGGAEGLAGSLGRADIFRRLEPRALEEVAALATEVSFPPGGTLVEHGRRGEAVYVILEGQVELTAPLQKGEITVRVAGPGETLPLACLLGEGELVTSAKAMSHVLALQVPRQRLLGLCGRRPDIAAVVYSSIAEIAMDRYRKMVGRLADTVMQALARAECWANV